MSGVATFGCFSTVSAILTEKFNRAASSWQNEFFTIDVHRHKGLKDIGRTSKN